MITILILTEKLTMNDKVASSIIGGFSGGITVISVTEFEEAEAVFRSEKSHIDLFILQINMKRKSGFKIAEQIRQMKKYKNTPILFITPLSYDMVGFHPLATFKKRMTLSGLCEMVGEEDFVQCHKSFAVNAQAVTELLIDGRRNWKAVFTSKESCPVSQTYYEDIWRRFIARRRNEE